MPAGPQIFGGTWDGTDTLVLFNRSNLATRKTEAVSQRRTSEALYAYPARVDKKENKKYAGIGGPRCGRDSDVVISRTRLMFASRQIWTSRPVSTDKRLDVCPLEGDAAKSPKFGDRWTSTLYFG